MLTQSRQQKGCRLIFNVFDGNPISIDKLFFFSHPSIHQTIKVYLRVQRKCPPQTHVRLKMSQLHSFLRSVHIETSNEWLSQIINKNILICIPGGLWPSEPEDNSEEINIHKKQLGCSGSRCPYVGDTGASLRLLLIPSSHLHILMCAESICLRNCSGLFSVWVCVCVFFRFIFLGKLRRLNETLQHSLDTVWLFCFIITSTVQVWTHKECVYTHIIL